MANRPASSGVPACRTASLQHLILGDDRMLTQVAKKTIPFCATYSTKAGSRSGHVLPLVEHRSFSVEIGCQSFLFYHHYPH
jgi:hypothetical protein